jgi:tetratricopeptide (TPR) repeat protein
MGLGLALVALVSCWGAGVRAQAPAPVTYQNADEAWAVGVAFHNSRNVAASIAPFEAALKLAPDDAFRLKVYDALLSGYRTLPDSRKFVEACEFIISKNPSAPAQSLTRRALLGFATERGQIDELVKRYDGLLRQDPHHRMALFILCEIYAQVKRDAPRAAELTERLAKLDQQSGKPQDPRQMASLASQYTKAKKFREGAELYEKIAPLDAKLAAWHWKEAAAAWLAAGDKAKALAAAAKAEQCTPEQRNDQLAHFWHRGLADVYLAVGEPKLAIPHYEQAIAKTQIQGYVDACKASLAEAQAKAGK